MSGALILDAVRTASGRGKPGGALSAFHPVDLAAEVIASLVTRTAAPAASIDDVLMGCVVQVGGQTSNLARNAALAAGLPESVPGATIDRQCGSSLQAATFAAQGIAAGDADLVIAGGVEMMSRNPIGRSTLGEDPFGEGIARRYPGGLVNQGISAELIAARWGLGRRQLDEYAAESHRRAAEAAAAGRFDRELVAVTPPGASLPAAADETVRPGTTADALAGLPPAFADAAAAARFPELGAWRITAGNASPLTDGASAVLLASAAGAAALGARPRARVVASAVVGSDPIEMLTGVIPATRKVLARAGLRIEDIDAYEVNEAFAPVPIAWLREVGGDPGRLNPLGGAIALGHALGATGTRLIGTLLGHLEATGGRLGLIAVCEGQGMANAMIIERLDPS